MQTHREKKAKQHQIRQLTSQIVLESSMVHFPFFFVSVRTSAKPNMPNFLAQIQLTKKTMQVYIQYKLWMNPKLAEILNLGHTTLYINTSLHYATYFYLIERNRANDSLDDVLLLLHSMLILWSWITAVQRIAFFFSSFAMLSVFQTKQRRFDGRFNFKLLDLTLLSKCSILFKQIQVVVNQNFSFILLHVWC